MMLNNTPFISVQKNRFGSSVATKTGFTLLLCLFFIFFMSASHADGLFDFQMKMAKKGNAEAEFKVGEMYETGFGVKEDKVEAKNWITKAANQGHETASFKLLYWDIEKNGLNDTNRGKYEALKLKADEGNSQAQYYIGVMYSRGVGMKKNSKKALGWLNKAALVGVLEAEREMELVRENQQRWVLEKQRRDKKKRAELKAKQKKQAQKKKQADTKARADKAAKKNAEASAENAKSKASKQAAAEKIQRDKVLAQQKATQQREAEKQALIKKREAGKKERKTQFESDPCSGKSARFLSTCK
ncbi:hypothetical protein MNBD_GAMMA06-1996 [hydrothermal vent metagenome]|uniref:TETRATRICOPEPTIDE REPEAT FAMILY PROTEIN n=1 Tax=hydrothermal vent metagenome TaxID=652676 RepID=A0A3B0WKV0_9ZZZZ